MMERLVVSFEPETMRIIEDLALQWEVSMAEVVRRLVKEGYERGVS